MTVDALLHTLNLVEVFVAAFLAVKRFLNAARLLIANLRLPWRGEDGVHVRVQASGLERLPFVLIKPHPAAIAALIERKVGAVADSVFDQNPVAFRAEFTDQRACRRVGRDGLSCGRFRQTLFMLFAPLPVFKRRDPIAATTTAMARGQIVFERRQT